MLNLKGIYAVLSRWWKCRKLFLVLIFWVKKLVGANFTRFCNYEVVEPKPDHLHVRILALSLLW